MYYSVPPTGLEILEKPTYVSEGKARMVTCQVYIYIYLYIYLYIYISISIHLPGHRRLPAPRAHMVDRDTEADARADGE